MEANSNPQSSDVVEAVQVYLRTSYFPKTLSEIQKWLQPLFPWHYVQEAVETLVRDGTLSEQYHEVRKVDVYFPAYRKLNI